jgi:hypothetical protein
MTEKLTESVTPGLDNPAPLGPLAGNYKDDDAEAYEDDFEAAPHGPVAQAGVPHKVEEIKPTTRLLVVTQTVGTVNGAIQEPLMLLPADPNRIGLVLKPWANANRPFVIGSSKSDCYSGAVIENVPQAPSIDLNGHTGAIWCYSTDAATIAVTAIAITQ